MANGYGYSGSSSSSSSSSPSGSVRQSTVNTQGQVAPPGFHYMPDGTLMSDVEHARLYSQQKVINDFILDYTDIPESGGNKTLRVLGQNGAEFILEITNEDSPKKYYNFETKTFTTTQSKLTETITNSEYSCSVIFPKVNDADKYDITLLAIGDTKHAPYLEYRRFDDTIDINRSKGSNSMILKKELYQKLDQHLYISALTPNASASHTGFTLSPGTGVRIPSVTSGRTKIPFSFTVSSGTGKAWRVDDPNPDANSVVGTYIERTLVSPLKIDKEDIWTRTARSTGRVVNGAVTSGRNVTMDDDVGSYWAIGDRITGNAALDAKTGDNAVTVTAINVGSNAKVFTMSEAIAIADEETLTFTEPEYHRWEIDNAIGIHDHMLVSGTNTETNTTTAPYETFTVVNEGTPQEIKISDIKVKSKESKIKTKLTSPIKKELSSEAIAYGLALDNDVIEADKPTRSINATTYSEIITDSAYITLDKQQRKLVTGDTVKFWGLGVESIEKQTGWVVDFSNVKVTATKPTTTTTAPVYSSTTVPVASGDGIMDDISTVSGNGIDSSSGLPTVTNIGSYSGATATLTLSSAQTLENGATLTFHNSAKTITISGDIEIVKVGKSYGTNNTLPNWNGTIYFNLEKLVKATTET